MLATFVRSFPIVQRLAELSCTALNEAFVCRAGLEPQTSRLKSEADRYATHAVGSCLGQLSEWWPEALLGPSPEGDSSIALKRLVVQAQTAPAQQAVHSAFLTLPAAPLVRRGLKGLS